MTHRQPPRVASAIAERLIAGSPRGDALLGDLCEEYARGRSRVWYWQQIAGALVTAGADDLRAHPWRWASAMLIGWTIFFGCSLPVWWLSQWIRAGQFALNMAGYDELWAWLLGVVGIEGAILVACVACGWLVGRVTPRSPLAVVAFAASIALFEQTTFVVMFLRYPMIRLDAVRDVTELARPACIILGGLWSARVTRDVSSRIA